MWKKDSCIFYHMHKLIVFGKLTVSTSYEYPLYFPLKFNLWLRGWYLITGTFRHPWGCQGRQCVSQYVEYHE